MNPTVKTTQPLTGYSVAAAATKYPKKDQGIIFDIIDGARNEDYLRAIAKKTDPKNILSASRITQNRFCFFVKSVPLVDELISVGNNVLTVGTSQVTMRPYVARLKRIILSNVYSFIPDQVLENKFAELGIHLKSAITTLHISSAPEFAHIQCHRRQVFVHPDDIEKIPGDFSITYDATTFHIFVTTDKMICFECKQEGHTSKHCPTLRQNKSKQDGNQLSSTPLSQDKADPHNTSQLSAEDNLPPEIKNTDDELAIASARESNLPSEQQKESLAFNGNLLFAKPSNTEINKKRNRTDLSSTASTTGDNDIIPDSQEDKTIVQSKKRIKGKPKCTAENISVQINLAKSFIAPETTEIFPLSYDQLIELLTSTIGVGYAAIVKDLDSTINIESLINMLQEVWPHTTDQHVKSRITKFSTALSGVIPNDSASETESVH